MIPSPILKSLRWQGGVPDTDQVRIRIPLHLLQESSHRATRRGFNHRLPNPETGESLLKPWVDTWKNRLLASPGFVLLASDDQAEDEELRKVYARVTRSLGHLNSRYGDFFDVRDRGLDHRKASIPVSKTNADTGFHTDSSARDYCPHVVGLLCLQPAEQGGESLLANAADLHAWLQRYHPATLPALCKPIHRDIITPGNQTHPKAVRNNSFPILKFDQQGLHFRYMRYWIVTAYQKLGRPLPTGLGDAMDHVDRFLSDSGKCFSTHLRRGEILLVNNRFLCHSRTAFVDSPEESKKRRLVRTWIDDVNPSPRQALINRHTSV